MQVCAAMGLLCALLLERDLLNYPFGVPFGASDNASATAAAALAPELYNATLGEDGGCGLGGAGDGGGVGLSIGQLVGYLVAVAGLVFALLLAEFGLVQLTSSLTLSILGIVKELCTIVLAGAVCGESLTATNMGGFSVVSLGALLYHVSKQKQAAGQCLATAAACSRKLTCWARSFWVRFVDEEPSGSATPSPSAARVVRVAPPAVSSTALATSTRVADARCAADRL